VLWDLLGFTRIVLSGGIYGHYVDWILRFFGIFWRILLQDYYFTWLQFFFR
jgi:hypothetical protein